MRYGYLTIDSQVADMNEPLLTVPHLLVIVFLAFSLTLLIILLFQVLKLALGLIFFRNLEGSKYFSWLGRIVEFVFAFSIIVLGFHSYSLHMYSICFCTCFSALITTLIKYSYGSKKCTPPQRIANKREAWNQIDILIFSFIYLAMFKDRYLVEEWRLSRQELYLYAFYDCYLLYHGIVIFFFVTMMIVKRKTAKYGMQQFGVFFMTISFILLSTMAGQYIYRQRAFLSIALLCISFMMLIGGCHNMT